MKPNLSKGFESAVRVAYTPRRFYCILTSLSSAAVGNVRVCVCVCRCKSRFHTRRALTLFTHPIESLWRWPQVSPRGLTSPSSRQCQTSSSRRVGCAWKRGGLLLLLLSWLIAIEEPSTSSSLFSFTLCIMVWVGVVEWFSTALMYS